MRKAEQAATAAPTAAPKTMKKAKEAAPMKKAKGVRGAAVASEPRLDTLEYRPGGCGPRYYGVVTLYTDSNKGLGG